jgi:HlyD family secretion protein
MKRIVMITIILATLIGATVYGYRSTTSTKAPSLADDPTVEVVKVGRETLIDLVSATGRVEPKAEVEMNFEMSGIVREVLVKQGQYVEAGTVLARLESTDLDLGVQRAEVELSQAKANLEKLFEPASAEKIAASQAKLESERLKLAELQNDPDQEDEVTKAAAALSLKQVELKKAQWAYDQVAYRGEVGAMGEADALQKATLEYETALAEYNIAVRDLQVSDGTLAEARSALKQAEADLAELMAGPTKAEIADQQAAVELAEITLLEKQRELDSAVLVAPIEGVILEVTIEPGERVLQDAQAAALVMADASAYLLKVKIDEIDIARIKRDQAVTIVVDAFAEKEFSGQVTDISPRPNEEEGNSIVTYEVTVAIQTPKESPGFLSGMTATANIETERLEDVLVIPNRAVKIERGNGQPVIYVEKLGEGEESMRVEVELGLRDETTTEVIAGLEEGDQVIIRRQLEAESQPSL